MKVTSRRFWELEESPNSGLRRSLPKAQPRWCPWIPLLMLFGASLAGALAPLAFLSGCQKEALEEGLYQCPMHPTYVSDRPGSCPICGMDIVKVNSTSAPSAAAPSAAASSAAASSAAAPSTMVNGAPSSPDSAYACPMHPSIRADAPGACPACGMPLEPVSSPLASPSAAAPSAASPGVDGSSQGAVYLCPMHPNITADHAGSCPICGMDLVQRPSSQTAPSKGGEATPKGWAVLEISQEGRRLAQVQTTTVRRERLVKKVRTVGIVTPDESRIRRVSLKTSGWLEALHIAFTGQQVSAGAPLVSLYSPELLAAQETYASALSMARALDAQAGASVKADAAALVAAARRRLELLDVPRATLQALETGAAPQRTVTFVSPVTGYVTLRQVRQGEMVTAGTTLMEVTDLSRVWVVAELFEADGSGVQLNQSAHLSSPYTPDLELTSQVSFIAPVVKASSRTLEVRFELDNPTLSLKPEMYLDVSLEADLGEGPVVPTSALIETGTQAIAFVETRPGRFEPRALTTGPRAGGRVRIRSGVEEGEQIVVGGNFLLDSESRIQAQLMQALTGPASSQTAGTTLEGGQP